MQLQEEYTRCYQSQTMLYKLASRADTGKKHILKNQDFPCVELAFQQNHRIV